MVTVSMIIELGPGEACARQANGRGWCWATVDAFHKLFGPDAQPGGYQSITHENSTIEVATPGAGVPPWALQT